VSKSNDGFDGRAQALESFSRHVSRGKVELFSTYGIDMVLGPREGVFLGDAYSDRRWFNCHCNGGVFNLGHRHPRVVEAVRRALETLDIGNHHLVSPQRAALARRLSESTGNLLPGVVFAVGGGEAIDLAIKVARGVTGRQKVVSARGGYHGHTGLALATGDPQYRNPFGPNPPGFVQVPFNDLMAVDRVVDSSTAAVILEGIPATLGMPMPEPGYLKAVQQVCDRRGAKLILDEVQTGLGRTGSPWFYQQEDVEPHILVTGKGLSGGVYPIAATLMRPELHAFFDDKPFIHISTFGGADLGCVAALTVLDLLEEPGFCERVLQLSERFAEGLSGLPFSLRRRGLMIGLKFPAKAMAMMGAKLLYDAGVFCVWSNNDKSVLQFLPPLVISDAETEQLIERVRGVFS
jgi:acetylornithine/succinyldiaminopimelate/putrescine aminotransferase